MSKLMTYLTSLNYKHRGYYTGESLEFIEVFIQDHIIKITPLKQNHLVQLSKGSELIKEKKLRLTNDIIKYLEGIKKNGI